MLTMPKRERVRDRHFDRGDRRVGALLEMEPQHLRVVHLVDVVAREHDDVARRLARDRVEVLIDGVGRAEIPVLADPLLRRQDLDELAELLRDDVPPHPDVTVERQRLVLRRDVDVAQPGIDAVAEREVDDPVRPAEIDRRLRAVLRERIQALSDSAGEQDDQDIVEFHGSAVRPSHRGGRSVVAASTIGVEGLSQVAAQQLRRATRKPRPAVRPGARWAAMIARWLFDLFAIGSL